MALKSCRECGEKVSSEANTCPKCGVPKPTQKNKEIEYVAPKAGPFTQGTFLDFWTGHRGLTETFWLYFVGGNIISNILFVFFSLNGIGVMFYILLVVTILWLLLSIVGVFNSADIYKKEKINSGLTHGYATAAKWTVVLLTMSGIGQALQGL